VRSPARSLKMLQNLLLLRRGGYIPLAVALHASQKPKPGPKRLHNTLHNSMFRFQLDLQFNCYLQNLLPRTMVMMTLTNLTTTQ
jgi:hypothetical protein